MQIFSKKEAVKVGWSLTKTNLGFIALAYGIYLGITIAISSLETLVEHFVGKGLLSFNLYIVSLLISYLLMLGLIKIFLDLYDGKKGELSDLFTNYEQYFDYLLANILLMLIVLGGLLLLIVPGIIWAIKYQFTPYLIIDRKMKPVEAIKMSGKITYGHKVNLFLFGLFLIGVNILGFLCCCVGIFFTLLISSFAVIHVYRKLLSDHEALKPKEPVAPVVSSGVNSEVQTASTPENTENVIPVEEPKTPENPE